MSVPNSLVWQHRTTSEPKRRGKWSDPARLRSLDPRVPALIRLPPIRETRAVARRNSGPTELSLWVNTGPWMPTKASSKFWIRRLGSFCGNV